MAFHLWPCIMMFVYLELNQLSHFVYKNLYRVCNNEREEHFIAPSPNNTEDKKQNINASTTHKH